MSAIAEIPDPLYRERESDSGLNFHCLSQILATRYGTRVPEENALRYNKIVSSKGVTFDCLKSTEYLQTFK